MNNESWPTVKFGEVVNNVRRNIKDREAAGIDRVLGLDDIETGNLHVTGWKNVDSSPSFRTYFKPTQTLFGKRRAYLRKVAYAEFEGVCTQNIMVFESKDSDILLPQFLPFVCMSEPFMTKAVETSSGSLFPNANWKSIQNFEFKLPPIELQHSISNLIWASDEVLRTQKSALADLLVVRKKTILELFSKNKKWSTHLISELGQIKQGRGLSPKFKTGAHSKPYVTVKHVNDLEFIVNEIGEMDFEPKAFEIYRLRLGDILVTDGDLVSKYNVARPAIWEDKIPECCYQNHLIRLRVSEKVVPKFMLYCLEHARLIGKFAAVASTTAISTLSVGRFKSVKVSIPTSLDEQEMISKRIDCIRENETLLIQQIEHSATLRDSLIKEMLED